MKRYFLITLSLLALSCEQTIDPFNIPYNCMLSKEVFNNSSATAYQYDLKDRLSTTIYTDNSKDVFAYGSNGKLATVKYFSASGNFVYSWEVIYGSDEKVSKIIFKDANNKPYSESKFTYKRSGIREDVYDYETNKLSSNEEWTFSGRNISGRMLKVFDSSNGKTVFTSEVTISGFQDGVNPWYGLFHKVPGYPYPESYNPWKASKETNIEYVNELAQPPQITACTYTYTYNKSNGVLIRISNCSKDGGARVTNQRSFAYRNCD